MALSLFKEIYRSEGTSTMSCSNINSQPGLPTTTAGSVRNVARSNDGAAGSCDAKNRGCRLYIEMKSDWELEQIFQLAAAKAGSTRRVSNEWGTATWTILRAKASAATLTKLKELHKELGNVAQTASLFSARIVFDFSRSLRAKGRLAVAALMISAPSLLVAAPVVVSFHPKQPKPLTGFPLQHFFHQKVKYLKCRDSIIVIYRFPSNTVKPISSHSSRKSQSNSLRYGTFSIWSSYFLSRMAVILFVFNDFKKKTIHLLLHPNAIFTCSQLVMRPLYVSSGAMCEKTVSVTLLWYTSILQRVRSHLSRVQKLFRNTWEGFSKCRCLNSQFCVTILKFCAIPEGDRRALSVLSRRALLQDWGGGDAPRPLFPERGRLMKS